MIRKGLRLLASYQPHTIGLAELAELAGDDWPGTLRALRAAIGAEVRAAGELERLELALHALTDALACLATLEESSHRSAALAARSAIRDAEQTLERARGAS